MLRTDLDHIILGINDLDRGIAWVEQRTGVRAIFGGVHPGRGTRNALLSLGPDCYLEIIAPDPQQNSPTWFSQVLAMPEPKIIAWAVHTLDLTALAQTAHDEGFPIGRPDDGARTRPDGKVLKWKLFHLWDNRGGLLPFFIEWDRNSIHPAEDAPAGCTLKDFHLQSPDAADLARACQSLAVDVIVNLGEEPLLLACISSPKGEIELTS
jgi:hypothetical protein